MKKVISLMLAVEDVLQTLDALNDRAEAWERTEASLTNQLDLDSDEMFFIPEDCDDPSEAAEIAQHFRDVISSIERQMTEQRS